MGEVWPLVPADRAVAVYGGEGRLLMATLPGRSRTSGQPLASHTPSPLTPATAGGALKICHVFIVGNYLGLTPAGQMYKSNILTCFLRNQLALLTTGKVSHRICSVTQQSVKSDFARVSAPPVCQPCEREDRAAQGRIRLHYVAKPRHLTMEII